MKVLLAYFSFTGNTEKVSKLIARCLHESKINYEIFRIEPALRLGYPLWLFLSFIPGLPFPVKNLKALDLKSYDAVILGSPKWTFNCPPVTYFIRFLKGEKLKAKSPSRIFLFITYGGFREDGYIQKLKKNLEKCGFNVPLVRKFKRSEVKNGKATEEINKFCFEILLWLNPSHTNIPKS